MWHGGQQCGREWREVADGSVRSKDNCNFFRVREGRFDEVFAYMSGDNPLA